MARQGWSEEDTYKVQDATSWGGFAGRAPTADTPGGLANGATQDINRYRGLGQAAAQRQAYQANFDAANSDRNNAAYARLNQQDAVGLQQQAAYGNAPSAAQSLSRNMLDQSLQAQMAGAASARGGSLAQAAAMRGASQQAMGMQQQGMNQIGALRAQEMAQARDAYMGASSQLRGQDYQAQALAQQQAGMQQQSELAQRQMNQQAQQNYEQMGWNTANAQQQAALEKARLDQNQTQYDKTQAYQRQEKKDDRAWSVAGAVLGGLGGYFSDENAKVPLAALAMSGGMGWHQGGGMVSGPTGLVSGPQNPVQAAGMGLGAVTAARSLSDEQAKVPVGALGAPIGYAASRANSPGYMFGAETTPDGIQVAPGTADYIHAMGGGASLDGIGAGSGNPFAVGPAPAQRSSLGGLGSLMGGIGRGMMSDERAKLPTGVMGYEENARIGPDGLGYVERPEAPSIVPEKFRTMQAEREGASGGGLAKAAMAQTKSRKMSDDELSRWADAELARVKRESDIRMSTGPAVRRAAEGTPENGYNTQLTEGAEKAYQRWREKNSPWDTGQDYDLRGAFADGLERDGRLHLPDTYKKPNHETFSVESKYAQHAPDEAGSWDGERYIPKGPPAWLRQEVRGSQMADAARAMASVPYAYKPGMQPPEQAPGEPNVGPIAQNMAQNPVTATAVKRDPATGLLVVDQGKMTKVLGGVVANQQQQIDQLAALVAKRGQ